jgi:hypothetical protein
MTTAFGHSGFLSDLQTFPKVSRIASGDTRGRTRRSRCREWDR